MEFRRISKDTVTCIITEDDMDEQGIKLEDLFEKKKEALDFLQDVMKKAEEEVDYKPTGSFMPMQITVLPDHSISLTLSENASASFGEILKNLTEKAGIKIPKNVLEDLGETVDEERINRLNEYLKSLKQLTNSVKNIVQESLADTNPEEKSEGKIEINSNATIEDGRKKASLISSGAKVSNNAFTPEEKERRDKNRLKFHEYVFTFNDIRTVIDFCNRAPRNIEISSSLYKNAMSGEYYLDLKRENESPKVFAALFTMAYEFGHFKATNQNVIAHYKENYECLIRDNAIDALAQV